EQRANLFEHADLVEQAQSVPESVPESESESESEFKAESEWEAQAFIPPSADEVLLQQRQLLRQQLDKTYGLPYPTHLQASHLQPRPYAEVSPHAVLKTNAPNTEDAPTAAIAIIGGGLAAAHCSLALAERGQATALFCQDSALGQGASGNRQGAIYPLLTPENDELSRFFQQAFLFSRRKIAALCANANQGSANASQGATAIAHDFCGVLQTGHDERSQQRLDKILNSQHWPREIAYGVNAANANHLAKLSIDKTGIFYPLGGWVSPVDYANAALTRAKQYAPVHCHFDTQIVDIEPSPKGWYLTGQGQRFGPFRQLVLANGAQLTQFSATAGLQLSPFRGQVSHVPAKGQLCQLATVLCANGYLTPSHNGSHCLGASYVKSPAHLNFCPQEQQENRGKVAESYPNQPWLLDIDISDNSARVGVRMVTRDHFPMVGLAPDVPGIFEHYSQQPPSKESAHYWQTAQTPVQEGLYILGGLGSRGLSSGPLAAECLAATLCGEPLPLDWPTLSKLNPNRMWLRKLRKGKALG
ncbi:MAG: FAD-dependent 5-carboxymethylaminomethyl-2-thiouridine(34) oxidoreductase MnmC, partial [Shewanella sp.]